MVWRLTFWKQLNVLGGFFTLWFFPVNSWVTNSEITLHTMSDVVVRLILERALTLVKGFITSTGFQLLERQLSWVITFVTEEIYLFNAIIPQLDHMIHCPKKCVFLCIGLTHDTAQSRVFLRGGHLISMLNLWPWHWTMNITHIAPSSWGWWFIPKSSLSAQTTADN